MRKVLLLFVAILMVQLVAAQDSPTVIIPNANDTRVITTGVPFLMITSDARAGGMGEMGVATSPDAYSQQWNPSKYAFAENQMGVGLSYTPYLSELVNDIALLNLTFYNRISDKSAWAASIKYFSLGEIGTITEQEFYAGAAPLIQRPNEFAIDASYSLRLSERYSMAVTGRYLNSNLRIQSEGIDASAASSFAVDISGYYQSEEIAYDDFNGRWRAGFNLSNVGPAISYEVDGQESFLPTNLRLGGGFDFIFDSYNKLSVLAEFNKLLVPTPPILGTERYYTDNNGNGQYDEGVDDLGDSVSGQSNDVIYSGQSNDVSFVSGMFQSFGDAPGGIKEELKEVTYAIGAEYWYMDSFALRAGYFNEAEEKGARKFFTLGAGFTYNVIKVDLSYLFSASKVRNPLENTLRFSLTLNFGDTYDED